MIGATGLAAETVMRFLVRQADEFNDQVGTCTLLHKEERRGSVRALFRVDVRGKTYVQNFIACVFSEKDDPGGLALHESTNTKASYDFEELADAQDFLAQFPAKGTPSAWYEFERIE